MLKAWMKSEKGAVLPLVGVAIFTLLMAAGLTIDYARALIVKERLQWALDAAALAGTKRFKDGDKAVQAEAQDYFEANFPTGYMDTSKAYVNAAPITPEDARGMGYRFTVTNMSMDTYIMTTVGLNTIGVGAEAEVNTMPITPLDVVFALDVSGSMQVKEGKGCYLLPYKSTCYGANPETDSKLASAKEAINFLVDGLKTGDDTRFGLVPWSSYVNPIGAIAGSFTTHNCDDGSKQTYVAGIDTSKPWIGNANNAAIDNYPMENPAKCLEFLPGTIKGSGALRPMVYLTENTKKFNDKVNEQKAEANTDGALGMYWAHAMLQDKTKGWVSWRAPAVNKSIILLTDGYNTKYYGNPSKANADTVGKESNTAQEMICNAARDDGIVIYTIAYDLGDVKGEDDPRYDAKELLEYCASPVCPYTDPKLPSNRPCFFDVKTKGQLMDVMRVIGQTMMTMRLTK